MSAKLKLAELTREQVIAIRARYRDGRKLADIAREFNVTWWTIEQCRRGGHKIDGKPEFEELPRRLTRNSGEWPTSKKAHRARRAKLVRTFWQAAEAQVGVIEARADLKTVEPAERERDARTMAVLAKTLHELDSFHAGQARGGKRGGRTETDPEVNYDDPRQIDDFRRELARRIAALAGDTDSQASG